MGLVGLHKPTCYIFKISACAYSHANHNFPVKWRTIQNAIWAISKGNDTKNLIGVLKRILHTYPDIFESATYPFLIRLPSTCIRWIQHTNPQLFESALQSGNFWIRYESGIVSAKSGYFFYPVTWKDRAQAPVVQKVDNAIHRINHYPLDRAIGFPNTYPWDSDLSVG